VEKANHEHISRPGGSHPHIFYFFNLSATASRSARESPDFLYDTARVLVLAYTDKLRMSQVISVGPFQKFQLSDNLRTDPHALFHLLGGQRLAHLAFLVSGRLANGQSGTISGSSFANTRRLEAGTKPFRVRAT
jgi:hypothetical protein